MLGDHKYSKIPLYDKNIYINKHSYCKEKEQLLKEGIRSIKSES